MPSPVFRTLVFSSINLEGVAFLYIIKKESNFEWTLKCKGIHQIQEVPVQPFDLMQARDWPSAVLYLSVSDAAVASALVWEDMRQ